MMGKIELPQKNLMRKCQRRTFPVVRRLWTGTANPKDNSTEEVKEIIENFDGLLMHEYPGFTIVKNHGDQ